jgi:hypothetical protein
VSWKWHVENEFPRFSKRTRRLGVSGSLWSRLITCQYPAGWNKVHVVRCCGRMFFTLLQKVPRLSWHGWPNLSHLTSQVPKPHLTHIPSGQTRPPQHVHRCLLVYREVKIALLGACLVWTNTTSVVASYYYFTLAASTLIIFFHKLLNFLEITNNKKNCEKKNWIFEILFFG